MGALPQYIEDAVEAAIFTPETEVVIKEDEVFIHKKSGDMALSRFLTRDLKFSDVFKADEIRDLAARLSMKRIPPDLWEPKTPQDYSKMYSEGPKSCMSNPPASNYTSYANSSDRRIYEETGLWSSAIYAYTPELQGVCMLVDKKIVARTFKCPGKLFWTIYGEKVFQDKLIPTLEDQGWIWRSSTVGSGKSIWFTERFTVPAIETKLRGPVFPFPSQCDIHMSSQFRIAYCKEDNQLYFEPVTRIRGLIKGGPGSLGSASHHFCDAANFNKVDKKPW